MSNPPLSLLLVVATFALAYWLFRPGQGLVWRWRRSRKMTARVLAEDALKHIHRCERHGRRPSLDSVAGALQVSDDDAASLLADLEARELVTLEGNEFRLTPSGRSYALHVIRAHRLWERYLAEETGFAMTEWHDRADSAEHDLSPSEADALAAELGHPTHDPHGDPIPTAAGQMVTHGGRPLNLMPPDRPLRIVHLEDEPEAMFAQIVAEGLSPGMVVQLIESSSRRVRFWADGDEHVLAPIVAANISVVPVRSRSLQKTEPGVGLSILRPEESGEVIHISQACRGSERRRFLDLGITPGTPITAEITSPGGDLTAYRIRDALIALRREQAAYIRVKRIAGDG
jgi:DtxR family Mn-dependent transcriptional regulator